MLKLVDGGLEMEDTAIYNNRTGKEIARALELAWGRRASSTWPHQSRTSASLPTC